MKKVRLAVIGTGHWGPNLVRNFNDDPRVELVVICDKDLARAKDVAARFRNIKVTGDARDVYADATIDAVIICTPTDSHYAIAKNCLESGKHLFIEKPMATTSAECEELISLAEQKNLKLFVGHVFLYNPAIQYIKKLIQNGDLGDVIYVYGKRVNLGPVRRDVNALWDLAPHDIAIFNYWLESEPEVGSATGISHINPPVQDVVFSTLRYPQNVLVSLHVSWMDPRKIRQIVVVGTKKMVVFDDLDPVGPVQIYNKAVTKQSSENVVSDTIAAFKVVLQEGDLVIPKIPIQEPLRNECKRFVDWLVEGTVPLSDGRNGISVVRALEALTKSLNGAGTEVEILEPAPSVRRVANAF